MKGVSRTLQKRIREVLLGGAILTSALILRKTLISAEETFSSFRYQVSREADGSFRADFPEEVEKNGRTYLLQEVIYHEEVPEPKILVPAVEKHLEEEDYTPEATLRDADTTYVLENVRSAKMLISGRTAHAEVSDRHVDEEIRELSALEGTKREAAVSDPVTGKTIRGAVPYAASSEEGTYWADDLSCRLVFTESDADFFELEGAWYVSNEQEPLPESAYPALLRQLPGNADEYRISSVTWSSEPYEQEHVLCRDASVSGESLHRIYRDLYAGEIALPDLTYVIYRLRYKESDQDLYLRTKADAEAVYVLKEP